MRRFVLDTNILLAYVRQNEIFLTAENQLHLSDQDAQLIVSVVTVGEINVLAQRNNWGEKKLDLLNQFFEQEVFIVDITIGSPDLLDAYVKIDTFSSGKNMGKNDLWIAATAKVTNAALVTTDGDFDHLDGSHIQLAKILPT